MENHKHSFTIGARVRVVGYHIPSLEVKDIVASECGWLVSLMDDSGKSYFVGAEDIAYVD